MLSQPTTSRTDREHNAGPGTKKVPGPAPIRNDPPRPPHGRGRAEKELRWRSVLSSTRQTHQPHSSATRLTQQPETPPKPLGTTTHRAPA